MIDYRWIKNKRELGTQQIDFTLLANKQTDRKVSYLDLREQKLSKLQKRR